MALGSQPRWTVRPAIGAQVDIDVGLRDYMLRIYNYMASGLALTGIVAYVFAQYLEANPALARSPVMFLFMLAPLGLVYTHDSIARVFLITAGTFGAMSLYGYTTRRDLTGMGSFLFMGLIGIVIASLVNIFLASSALQFAISVIGVIVFVGLTAYDTQQIKDMYFENDDAQTAGKKAIMGALRLYLDFINLFMMLLQLFGSRRD